VLTGDGNPDPPIVATGPQVSSFPAAVEHLAETTGWSIRYLRVSTERCAALLADQDVSDEVVGRLTRVLTTLLDGDNAQLSAGVERTMDAGRVTAPTAPARGRRPGSRRSSLPDSQSLQDDRWSSTVIFATSSQSRRS
jgi:hypothetical protein